MEWIQRLSYIREKNTDERFRKIVTEFDAQLEQMMFVIFDLPDKGIPIDIIVAFMIEQSQSMVETYDLPRTWYAKRLRKELEHAVTTPNRGRWRRPVGPPQLRLVQ